MTADFSATVDVTQGSPVSLPGDVAALASLVRYALGVEGATGDWEISIALMSDAELRRLHREFMGLDTVTDILTFPFGDEERGGDIAISVERAIEQAPEYAMTAWEEIRFLVVHGVLHLCGWDDGSTRARRDMLTRQAEIIACWLTTQRAGSSRR